MRIQHNIMAMNAYRNMGKNNGALSKNLEKLSSGYRINRAGDDAAGLAISEKMRAQIAGLDQAQKNAQSGINLVQTAEGALTEVHDMLNRMVTLSTQAANGTYSESDRAKIQAEIDSLTEEIDRIADNSNFNGTKLLDGSLAAEATTAVTDNETINLEKVSGAGVLTTVDATQAKTTFKFTDKLVAGGSDGILEVKVGLSDGTGVTVNVAIASNEADIPKAISDALSKDETLKALFTVTKDGNNASTDPTTLSFQANETGSGALTVKTLTFAEKKISNGSGGFDTATAQSIIKYDANSAGAALPTAAQATIIDDPGTDAYKQINFGDDPDVATTGVKNEDLLGKKTEIGDKTYVFVDGETVHDLEEGEVGVYLGTSRNETMKNLVASLKANGVESAEIDGNNVKIGDTTELEVANEVTNSVKSDSASIDVDYKEAQNAKFEFAVAGGASTATTNFTATLSFKDADGVEKSVKVTYQDTDTTAGYEEIAAAINNNDTLKELFTASVDTGKLVIEAKGDVKGATVTNLQTSDAGVTVGALTTTTEAHAAGLTVDLDTATLNPGETITVNGKTYEFATADSMKNSTSENTLVAIGADKDATAANLMGALKNDGVDSKVMDDGKLLIENTEEPAKTQVDGGMTLQIGSEAVETINVTVDSVKAEDLGIKGLKIGTPEDANAAIEKVKAAIEKVSVNRGNLGAVQNRLEHTINNLGVMEENIQDAEANIRDTDIADEMMAYTKNNILIQSAQAMLAQANQAPQGVLQLMG